MKSIELEGEGPSFRVGIIALKDVAAGSVSPFIDRFLDDTNIKIGEESAFACSEVALDRNYSWHF